MRPSRRKTISPTITDEAVRTAYSTRQQPAVLTNAGLITALLLVSLVTLSACGGGSGSSGGTRTAGLDPLVEDFGIAYVRQPLPDPETATEPDDVRLPIRLNEGSDLIFRDLASPGANERNITARVTGGLGDVRDVEVSFDGSKLLFALRLPDIEGAAPEDQPSWNIWEYDIAADILTRVIQSDINAEAGQDIAPNYLPDGRIIFASTRQRTSKATLLDEGKPQFSALDENRNSPALVLHVMNNDGTDIHQVTYNQSHDLDPTVLSNGEVVFSRWDNAGSNSAIHLYTMYPDGTNLRLLYGAASHDSRSNATPVHYLQPRELTDGAIAAVLKPFTGTFLGGDIVSIDVANYINSNQPTAANEGVLTGPGQVSLAFSSVRAHADPSPGGRFNAFYPLWDGTQRALVSWTQCRLLDNDRIIPCTDETLNDPNFVAAPPLYGVYLYEIAEQTLVPVFTAQEGVLYRDAVAAQPRPLPTIHFDGAGIGDEAFDFDPTLISENVGVLHIRSVHDMDGRYDALGATAADLGALADPQQTLAAERPARFLRIVKAVSIPDDDVLNLDGTAFGISAQQGMREIIGYAPIEPDGSVRVKIPANIPFTISVLDKDGKRISRRHQNWLQLRPGEIMNCAGCHDPDSGTSHGRFDAFNVLNAGAPFDGYLYPNTETYFVDTGETMAEARTRLEPATLEPSVDIRYRDVWTDETAAERSKDAAFDYLYADLDAGMTAPASVACQNNWDSLCRIVINYETHIHPLWSVDRGPADTCVNCHSADDMGVTRIADGQLDLSDGASDLNPDHFKAYRELLSRDNEQELVMGVLQDRLVQAADDAGNPLFQTDADGNLTLDSMGNPIALMATVGVAPSMRTAGAHASRQFFDRFAPGGSHAGRLSPAELKLIAEWLDIGGQYYNNPFDVPP